MELNLNKDGFLDLSTLEGKYHAISVGNMDDIDTYLVRDDWYQANKEIFQKTDHEGQYHGNNKEARRLSPNGVLAEILHYKELEDVDVVFRMNVQRQYTSPEVFNLLS